MRARNQIAVVAYARHRLDDTLPRLVNLSEGAAVVRTETLLDPGDPVEMTSYFVEANQEIQVKADRLCDQEGKMRSNPCSNLNHGRANAPVRHCPMCGEVVNERTRPRACTEKEHAERRRAREKYCVDCGVQLIEP